MTEQAQTKIICTSCSWTGSTRHAQLADRHRCPKCGQKTIQPVK